jgi:hypothetical protein
VVFLTDTASQRVVKDRFDVRKGSGDGRAHEEGDRSGVEPPGIPHIADRRDSRLEMVWWAMRKVWYQIASPDTPALHWASLQ